MDTALIDQLIKHCLVGPLTDDLLVPLLGSSSREEFCDAFSRRVAHECAASRLSFEVGDAAMNRLFAFAYLGTDNILPEYSWDVFLAFDDGEYAHREDADDVDPEIKYTRPQINEIVARDLAGLRP